MDNSIRLGIGLLAALRKRAIWGILFCLLLLMLLLSGGAGAGVQAHSQGNDWSLVNWSSVNWSNDFWG